MLNAVRSLVPQLAPFVHSAYGEPSTLFSRHCHQGREYSSFCLSIHELCSRLESDLCLFYLDDGTLGGSPQEVLQDFQRVEQGAVELGLSLNHEKSEVISIDPAAREPLLTTAPNLSVTNPDCASLLGSPLGSVDCIDQVISDKTESLPTMGDRLSYLHAQDALLLLRHSFAIPKLLYTLRTLPCFLSSELSIYDNILKSITSMITNVPLGNSDMAWTQASLPVKLGVLASGVQYSLHLLLS